MFLNTSVTKKRTFSVFRLLIISISSKRTTQKIIATNTNKNQKAFIRKENRIQLSVLLSARSMRFNPLETQNYHRNIAMSQVI